MQNQDDISGTEIHRDNLYSHYEELVIHFPDDLDFDNTEMSAFIAAKLYGDRKLSLGEAAKMAGVEKWDFPHILAKFGVPYFTLTPEELSRDVQNARPRHS